MTGRKSLGIICIIFFIFVYGFSAYLFRIFPKQEKAAYYLPSIEYLRLVSGTFRPLAADLLFIKGVLDIPEKIPDKSNYLINLFKTSINLDPKLTNAYFFGGVVVPHKKEEINLGISFLKEGMALNPSEWRIPFWIGFSYLETGAYSKVIEYYRIASELPGSPDYLKTNLAYFYYRTGKFNEGVLYMETLADSLNDDRVKGMLEVKTGWLKNIIFLETKLQEYKELYGEWPSILEDLVDKKLIEEVPRDSFGQGYYLEQDIFGGMPKVKSKF